MRTTSTTIKNTTGWPFTLKGSNSHEYPVVYCSDTWDIASNNKMSNMFSTGQYNQSEINQNVLTLLSLVFDVVRFDHQVIDTVEQENKLIVTSPYTSFGDFDAFCINGEVIPASSATHDANAQVTSLGLSNGPGGISWSDSTPNIATISGIISGTEVIGFKKK